MNIFACQGFKCLELPHLNKLKEFILYDSDGLEWVYVNGKNVYSVHITAKQTPRQIIVTPCKNLKELTLCEVVITDGWLCKQISEPPFLEYLYVKYCGKLRNVKIISPRLKKLDFTSTEKLVELKLNTPNLSMFKTSGSMLSFSSNALALSETVFYYTFYVDKYVKLIELIAKFDHRYEVLNLICNHKVVIVPSELREILFPP